MKVEGNEERVLEPRSQTPVWERLFRETPFRSVIRNGVSGICVPKQSLGTRLLGFLCLICVHLCPSVANSADSSQVIERLMSAAWARDKVKPAALSDDAEF